jgi:putative peptide zinc metalloprotease protein
MPSATNPPKDEPLPPLREDIVIASGPRRPDGAPSWVVLDPAANAHFNIGWREFEILSRWGLGEPAMVAAAVAAETTLTATRAHVEQVAQFLAGSGLVRVSAAKLMELRKKTIAKGFLARIGAWLGAFMFKKIPLLAPDPFLRATVFLVRPLFSIRFLLIVGLLLLLALYLVGRQWGAFVAGFEHLYSLEGALSVALALTVAKGVHELAHAYAATLAGVEVPSMGVSLIMLWPVLYTETSGAWRVPDRRKRLTIAAAGVGAELVLAVLALAAWPFLDPGWLRNTFQFAATSLVLLSIAINANPLMRFDGYFVACDLTGIDNLQSRALAMLGWTARRIMAGTPEPSPEPGWPLRQQIALTAFGGVLGLYRITLYAGIAFGLAAFVFPALGMVLAGLVVICFLIQPVTREVVRWFLVATKRLGPVLGPVRVSICLLIILLPLIVPWRTSLMAPVLLRLGQAHAIFAPEPGQITKLSVVEDQIVVRGQPLIELATPDVTHKLEADRLKAERLTLILDRHLTGAGYREDGQVEATELQRLRADIAGLEARRERLVLRAPSDGVVRGLDAGLSNGVWVQSDRPLLQIVAGNSVTAEAFIEERDLSLVAVDAAGSIWLEGHPLEAISVRVLTVFGQAVPRIEQAILAAPGGGPIAVKAAADRSWAPDTALYKAELDVGKLPESAATRSIETRGFAIIETPPRNLLGRILDRIVGVWRREIG